MIHRLVLRSAARPALFGLTALLLAGCEKELEKPYQVVSDDRFPTLLSNNLGLQTKYAAGEIVPVELQFTGQESAVQEVRIFQRIEPATDSAVVQTLAGNRAAFSRRKNVDTLIVNFVMPTGANKSRVRMSALVVSENGLTKTRSVNFRLAEATPTVRIASATNVSTPANTPQITGDVVRYSLVLNENGITSYPEAPNPPPAASSILYKDLDSLITYVRVGTTAERRLLRQRLPAAGAQTGAQTTVNLDIPLPTATAGQSVVYRFEAKSRYLGTPNVRTSSVTAAPITVGTATPLAATRSLSLTYSGTTGGDQAALDLTTFTTVPAAGAAANKDLAITSIASNAVRIQALNPTTGTPTPPPPTRFVRLTTGGAAAFTNATLNSIRQLFLAAPAANQVTQLDNLVVGDVVVARIRGGNQYAILSVTAINRTASLVTVNFDLKAQ